MRRLAALLLPVLALSACVGPAYGPRTGGGRYDQRASERWYDREDLPLAARISPRGNSDFSVDLNRPAYVAVFEILPGQGVGLLYPRYEREDAYFPAGFSPLDLTGTSRDYNWYSSSLSGRYSRSEPRAYFLVASKRPLRISRFQRGGGTALRSVLGLSDYGAVNYQSVMNDLVGAIVPDQPNEDWTTDVYTAWPSRGDRYYYAQYPQQYVQVYCGDGTFDVVPVELARFACGRNRGGIAHRGGYGNSNGGNVPPPRRDTTHVTPPGRRRPEPLTGAGETSGGASGTRRPRPLGRPETAEPVVPRGGGGDEPRVAPIEGPRREPRAAPREEPRPQPRREEPRVEPRDEPRSEPRVTPRREAPVERSEPQERPRAEPVYQAPRSEPVATPREAPRSEPVYQAPRAEPVATPRSEPVYQAPREAPRSEPVYSAPPPRSEPVYSAPPPSPPPAPASEPAPSRVSSPVEPAA